MKSNAKQWNNEKKKPKQGDRQRQIEKTWETKSILVDCFNEEEEVDRCHKKPVFVVVHANEIETDDEIKSEKWNEEKTIRLQNVKQTHNNQTKTKPNVLKSVD